MEIGMSHHLDSPLARQDPRLDITDLFVFRGERGTVFISNHSHSLAGEDIPRGFQPEGMYEFKIDGDGDAVEDLTFRFTFGERGEDGVQSYELRRLVGSDAGDPSASGTVVARGRSEQSVEAEGGSRAWVGKASDPFFIDPDVLKAAGSAFQNGTALDLSHWDSAEAKNLFAGHTVYSIVLEVPDGELLPITQEGNIGVWALTSLATDSGGWGPINRAGLPMIHPLFAQLNDSLGNDLNTNKPADDLHLHGSTIADMVAAVVSAYGAAENPQAYARVFVDRLFPNMLPYGIGTQASYSFASWNGRTLTDNTPDVMLTLACNHPIAQGISKDSVATQVSRKFPYVPPTPPGSV
ncbi:DUF4331 family protein [Streptomyces sp. NPDC094473]|uniref:DUF4331 family protein n=1 Tax=Streptomyces sp. NPDC094473 TaxID=3366068 RepID=UPI0038125956